MRLVVLKRMLGLSILGCGILLGGSFTSCASADDAVPAKKSVEKKDVAKESAPEKKKVKKFSGRLPVYFGDVVSGDQREAIYEIQASYADRMAALVAQVKALQAQQMSEIEAVLTDEQKKKVADLKAAALAKRKSRAAAIKAANAKPGTE